MTDNYDSYRFKSNISSNHGTEPSNLIYSPNFDTGPARIAPRPPLPPPRNHNSSYSYSNPWSYGNYSGYPSYNRPAFGGYNSYSSYNNSYSSYNNLYNPMGGPRIPYDSSFTEDAQESSREAFANIERIVHTFGSVNMMIESTYYALQSSFNAVMSVAENLSRLKTQFGQILSAFTLIRSIQWLYKKLLYLLGLRSLDPTTESAWRKAASTSFEESFDDTSRKSVWPMMIFIASVYVGPLLMWKFISLLKQKEKLSEKDAKKGNNYYAVAKYSYKAQSPEELSFNAGDYLKLAPYEKQTDKSWPLAWNGKRSGIVPVNYIDIKLNSLTSSLKNETSVNSVPCFSRQDKNASDHLPDSSVEPTAPLDKSKNLDETKKINSEST